MKKTLLAVAITAASVSAMADTKLSGFVSYRAGFLEDFNEGEGLSVDEQTNASSRFRILSSIEANGIKYGIREEFGLGSGRRPSGDDIGLRFNELWVKGSLGKFSLGLGSEAGDGATEKDFSGTYFTTNSELETFGNIPGRFGLIRQVDGGRTDRIRYDTHKLGGVASLAFSIDENETFNGEINAGGKGWAFGAFFSAADENTADTNTPSNPAEIGDRFGLSVAAKLGGGFNIHASYGERDDFDNAAGVEQDGHEFLRLIAGYRTGHHAFAIDYQQDEDDSGSGEVETVGLSYVYRPTKGVEFFASVRQVETDGASLASALDGDDDGTGFLFGGRIIF